MKKELSDVGREQVAVALILLKDFKTEGKMDIEVTKMILGLAEGLGVLAEYNALLPKIPPMKIVPRGP